MTAQGEAESRATIRAIGQARKRLETATKMTEVCDGLTLLVKALMDRVPLVVRDQAETVLEGTYKDARARLIREWLARKKKREAG